MTSDRYDYSDGSVLTHCSISDISKTYSNSYLFKATQVGAKNGSCLVVYDVDGESTGGFWEFVVGTGGAGVAKYSDPGTSTDGRTFSMTCTKY